MSNPVYQNLSSGYFTCDRDPTSSETIVNAIPFPTPWLTLWWNQTSENLFYCNDPTQTTLVWHELVNDSSTNIPRSYSSRSSPAFNTNYTTSSTNDCFVIAVVNVTSTLVTPGTVLFQLNDSGSFLTRGKASVSGVAASNFQTISCIVPATYSYKLLNSSGTASIISINELLL